MKKGKTVRENKTERIVLRAYKREQVILDELVKKEGRKSKADLIRSRFPELSVDK